jgi:hypothetical protein
MDQNQRRARITNMRKTPPLPRIRTAPTPDSVHADLDAIDRAADDPTIHAATNRIRAALSGTEHHRKDEHMPESELTIQDVDPVDTWAELRDEQARQDAEAADADRQQD